MEKNIWKDAFGQLDPDKEKEQQIWDKIVEGQKEPAKAYGSAEKNRSFRGLRRAFIAAACLAIVAAAVIFQDSIQEKIAGAWNHISKPDSRGEEIVENITDYRMGVLSGYAPILVECNNKMIIFAESTGLVVYDRKRKTVAAVVDLQDIGCNYFNGQKLETRILPKGAELFVYNVKEDEPVGKAYCFDLSQCGTASGEVLAAVGQADITKELQGLWESHRKKHYLDTFETFQDTKAVTGSGSGQYSEYSFKWRDDNGTNISCLVIGGKAYDLDNYSQSLRLCTIVDGERDVREESLAVSVEKKEEGQVKKEPLPSYSLVCDNAVEQALVDFAVEHPAEFRLGSKNGRETVEEKEDEEGDDGIFVPVVRLYAQRKYKGGIQVYGQAGNSVYQRLGNTLYESSAGCGLFSARLEKIQDGYQVKKILRPGDGAGYYQDMITFCDGDEKWFNKNVLEKYQNDGNKIWSKQKKQLKGFLDRKGLDLQIYQ